MDDVDLQELCRQALAIGEELFSALSAPASAERIDRLQESLSKRRPVLERIVSLIGSGTPEESATAVLAEVVRQQEQLEAAWEKTLARMRQSSGQVRQAQHKLQGVQRLLDTGNRSRLVDKRG